MRNGNVSGINSLPELDLILFILPMRNGNSTGLLSFSKSPCFLFILPMRNGNFLILNHFHLLQPLFILPMRNGNNVVPESILNFKRTSFLSYLWGMETLNKLATMQSVLTFLSYLWGMETQNAFTDNRKFTTFYPTYEEWKHWWFSGFYSFS